MSIKSHLCASCLQLTLKTTPFRPISRVQVRATESLLSLSHILKMFFLLNNEDEGSARLLEANQEQATKNLEQVKEEAKDLMAKLLAKQ